MKANGISRLFFKPKKHCKNEHIRCELIGNGNPILWVYIAKWNICRGKIPFETRMEINNFTVREAEVSGNNGGANESPRKPIDTIVLWCSRAFRGASISFPWCRETIVFLKVLHRIVVVFPSLALRVGAFQIDVKIQKNSVWTSLKVE